MHGKRELNIWQDQPVCCSLSEYSFSRTELKRNVAASVCFKGPAESRHGGVGRHPQTGSVAWMQALAAPVAPGKELFACPGLCVSAEFGLACYYQQTDFFWSEL